MERGKCETHLLLLLLPRRIKQSLALPFLLLFHIAISVLHGDTVLHHHLVAVWLGAVAGGAVAVAAVGGGWRLHLVCLVTLFFFSCVFFSGFNCIFCLILIQIIFIYMCICICCFVGWLSSMIESDSVRLPTRSLWLFFVLEICSCRIVIVFGIEVKV